MMTAIAILCSIVFSLGICIYFRGIDKNNNAMESVKKYANKRQEDLLKLYNEIQDKFRLLITEFNAQQTQANAAIKLLKQQNEEFNEKLRNFEQNIAAVQNIKNQIDHYSKIITDLNQMTDQVEENLERIHKESGIVDKVTAKMDKQQQIVENIEKKIPQISQSFSDHNAEQLKAVASKLLQEYDTYATNLSGRIAESQKDAENALASIKQNIQNVYNEAADKAEKLENTAFAHLSEKAQARSEQYMKELKDQTASLQAELTNQFNTASSNIASRFNELSEDMNKRSAALQAAFEQKANTTSQSYKDSEDKLLEETKKHLAIINEKFTEKLNSVANSFTEKVEALQGKYVQQLESIGGKNDSSIAKIVERFEQDNIKLEQAYTAQIEAIKNKNNDNYSSLTEQFNSDFQTFKASYDNTFQSVSSENADKLSALQNDYSDRINDLQLTFGGKLDELTTLKDTIVALQNEISASLKKITSEASQSVERTESSVQEIKAQCEAASQKAATLQPELENKIKEVNANIDAFQTETNVKLESLSKIITDSVRKAVSESEVKHLNILEDVDSQLSTYKKDIEYKLSQLQVSDADIDTLEKSLKAAMAEVQNRVLHDFDNFTTTQKQKHEEFSQNIKQDSATLETKINAINQNLEDLRTAATGSMSAKLQEFEATFNQTLSTKNNQIDSELSEWKHDFDSRLTSITNNYEDSRRQIESKYMEDLKTNFENLQNRTTDQNAKLSVSLEQTKQEMEDAIADIRDVITKFKSDTGTSITAMTQNAELELKREIEKNVENIQTNLSKSQERLLRDLQDFEEAIRSKQETGTSTIDAALSEFTSWKQQFKNQLDDSTRLFTSEIETYKTTSKLKLDDITNNLITDMNSYGENIQKQHAELNKQIEDLQNKTDSSLASYEARSNQILSELNSMYEQMLTATEQKVREQNADASLKIESLKKDIQDATAANQISQSSIVSKMQDDANNLQIRIGEIAKELQEVRGNLSVYDKAEKMKEQLEDQIEELAASFARLEVFSDTANKMNSDYNSILKLNEDLNRQLTNFESQKTKVMNLEQQFNRMITLANSIDDRIMSLNTTKDDLQSMEVTVRNYNDRLQYVSEQYERLEKKDDVVSRIITDVDNQFEKLKDLEQRLMNCNRQAVSLPQEIKEVQANVDKILQNGPKISDAIGRLENLDSLISETDSRLDALNSVQSGLKKTELNLQSMNRDIDNKYNVLKNITQKEMAGKPAPKNQALNPQTNESVRQLKRQGWTNAEIADKLNLSEIEVDLILQLPE